MHAVDLHTLTLREGWFASDATVRFRSAFALFAGTGAQDAAVVYFEIEPGRALGTHTDSAEEVVLVLDGTVDVVLGGEHGRLTAGQLALVPASVPHSVRNVGAATARCVGFFAAATVVSTFAEPLQPVGRRELGTPPAAPA